MPSAVHVHPSPVHVAAGWWASIFSVTLGGAMGSGAGSFAPGVGVGDVRQPTVIAAPLSTSAANSFEEDRGIPFNVKARRGRGNP
jgi:hypothetical protein